MRALGALAMLLLSSWAAAPHAAEVTIAPCSGNCLASPGFLILEGPIEAGDLEKLQKMFSARPDRSSVYMLALDSAGGSVSEAIAIGRWLQRERIGSYVHNSSICYSACVFTFAGGATKWPNGRLGIHRPYFEDINRSEVAEALRDAEELSLNYLRDVNIPQKLATDMFTVPPEELRVLNKNDLRQYRLDQGEMVASEELALSEAKRLHISRGEYNTRLAKLKASGRMQLCEAAPPSPQRDKCALQALLSFGLLIPEKSTSNPVD